MSNNPRLSKRVGSNEQARTARQTTDVVIMDFSLFWAGWNGASSEQRNRIGACLDFVENFFNHKRGYGSLAGINTPSWNFEAATSLGNGIVATEKARHGAQMFMVEEIFAERHRVWTLSLTIPNRSLTAREITQISRELTAARQLREQAQGAAEDIGEAFQPLVLKHRG